MTSSTTAGRKESERTKLIQEKCQTLLTQMLRDEDNKYCVDCDAKGPRWASWNLGVFLCIRCAGIHRNLGVHISRVKSVNLDTWTPEQVISLQQMGNSRARAVYEAQLPDGFRRPQTDTALESFIRAKYEHKKYIAREWVPPSPPKVDWGKEIDEELERQKRKKKAAQAGASLGVGIISGGIGSSANEKKSSTTATTKSVPLPAPLPKPKSNTTSGSSPKTQRISIGSSDGNQTNDLLGLSSPIKTVQASSNNANNSNNDFGHNDSFSGFLDASSQQQQHQHHKQQQMNSNPIDSNGLSNNSQQQQNSLAKEEEDFFNQGSLSGTGIGEKDSNGKLTKDSILALYGSGPKNPSNPPMMGFGQNPAPGSGGMFGVSGGFAGLPPGFMNTGNPGMPGQQFMTPPNSTSLYNTPVMTAPAAFSASGMNTMQMAGATSFATQFPMQSINTGFASMAGGAGPNMMAMNGAGLMQTGPSASPLSIQQSNMNIMQTNQNLISGLSLPTMAPQSQASGMSMGMPPLASGMNSVTMPMLGLQPMSAMNSTFPSNPAAANTASNLNQQFGNLNLGNVWQ